MPIQVIIVILIGIVFIYFGYLIFTGKVPTLLDYFLKQGVLFNDERWLRTCGAVIVIIGIIVVMLPFVLGIENMNL